MVAIKNLLKAISYYTQTALISAAIIMFSLNFAAAQSTPDCKTLTSTCSNQIDPECLSPQGAPERFGAGAIAPCDSQLAAYKQCVATAIETCNPGQTTANEPQPQAPTALAAWQNVKDADDPEALEAFASAYQESSLSNVALNRAKTLREDAARRAQEEREQAIWAKVEALNDPDAYETFAAENPQSLYAEDARNRAAALRASLAQQQREQAAEQAWLGIKDSSNPLVFDRYREQFAGTSKAKEAAARAEELRNAANQERMAEAQAIWEAIKDLEDPTAFEKFAANYPDSPQAATAAQLAAALTPSSPTVFEAPSAPAEQTEQPNRQTEQQRFYAAVQTELKRVGVNIGAVDGVWGPRSRAGLQQFLTRTGFPRGNGEPTRADLDRLRAYTGRLEPVAGLSSSRSARGSAKNYQAHITWVGDPSSSHWDGDCTTRLIAVGSHTYSAEYQRCDGDQVSYHIEVNPTTGRMQGHIYIHAPGGPIGKALMSGSDNVLSGRRSRQRIRMELTPVGG